MASSARRSLLTGAKFFLARVAVLHAQLPNAVQFFLEMALAAVGLVVLWALGGLMASLRVHFTDLFVDFLSAVKEFAVFAIVATETVRGLERFDVANNWPRRALKGTLNLVAVVGIMFFGVLAIDNAIDGARLRLKVLPLLLQNGLELAAPGDLRPGACLPPAVVQPSLGAQDARVRPPKAVKPEKPRRDQVSGVRQAGVSGDSRVTDRPCSNNAKAQPD
jgi:hypothetical protein